MTNHIIVSSPDESIYDCARKMAYKKISSLIVIENMFAVGIITEQDISRKVVAKGLLTTTTPVSAIMSTNLTSISQNKDLQEAIQLMGNNEIKHLPVIENKNILGIITSKDIIAIEPILIEMLKFNHLNNKTHENNNY